MLDDRFPRIDAVPAGAGVESRTLVVANRPPADARPPLVAPTTRAKSRPRGPQPPRDPPYQVVIDELRSLEPLDDHDVVIDDSGDEAIDDFAEEPEAWVSWEQNK